MPFLLLNHQCGFLTQHLTETRYLYSNWAKLAKKPIHLSDQKNHIASAMTNPIELAVCPKVLSCLD